MRIKQRTDFPKLPDQTGTLVASASTEDHGNLFVGLGAPTMTTFRFTSSRRGKDRFYAKNLNSFASVADDYYEGFEAHIYVVENKELKLIRQAPVVGSKVDLSSLLQTLATSPIAGTSYQYDFDDWNRDGAYQYYFAVAAVDADGAIGAKSAWVPWTSPEVMSRGMADSVARTTVANAPYDGGTLPPPGNVQTENKPDDDSVAQITWNPVSGAAGYVVYLSWQDPSLNAPNGEEYLEIGGSGRPIPEGAWVVLRRISLESNTNVSARVWDVVGSNAPEAFEGTAPRWTPYTPADPSPLAGDHVSQYFRRYTATGTFYRTNLHQRRGGDVFWEVLEPGRNYRCEIVARSSAPTTMTMNLPGTSRPDNTVFGVDGTWRSFTHDFSVNAYYEGNVQALTFSATGDMEIDIARLMVFDTALDVDDLDFDRKQHVATGMFLRDHRFVKHDEFGLSLESLTNETGYSNRYFCSMRTILRQCQINDLLPWLQTEWNLPPEVYRDLVAYLAAPVSSGHPMAMKRAAQGQIAPWVDTFSELKWEIGNESWLSNSTLFWSTPNDCIDIVTGEVIERDQFYGMLFQYLLDEMSKSPFWGALREKTEFVIGGHVNSAHGADAAAEMATPADALSISAYIGGWESGGSTAGESGQSFLNVLDYGVTDVAAHETRADEAFDLGLKMHTYEFGPGYDFVEDEEEISQEVVMKSRAAGTANLDAVARRAVKGYGVECFFRLRDGNGWCSHSIPGQGGGRYLSWGLLKLIHETLGRVTTRVLPTVQNPLRAGGHPTLGAFEFRSVEDPTSRIILALNRDIDVSLLNLNDPLYSPLRSGLEPCSVIAGIASCESVQYYANVGNFREHNRYPVGQRLDGLSFVPDPLCVSINYDWTPGSSEGSFETVDIDTAFGAESGGLPAGNCVLIHMTGCIDA